MIENTAFLRTVAWILNYCRWRLLGLQMPPPGRTIPRIWRGVRIRNPKRIRLDPLVQLRPFCVVRSSPGTVEIGAHTGVGDYSIINAVESVKIGRRVMIAAQCHITDGNHDMTGRGPMQIQGRSASPVVIEDEAWIGTGVTITAGVTIGRGAVVGAGAVVTRSVEPFQIVAGVPARPIGSR